MPPNHDAPDPVEIPIDGTLDLHTFHPRDLPELIDAYIEACLEKSIYSIRIIHGKGIGTQRNIVHSLLNKDPRIRSFQHPDSNGNWGVTVASVSVEPK